MVNGSIYNEQCTLQSFTRITLQLVLQQILVETCKNAHAEMATNLNQNNLLTKYYLKIILIEEASITLPDYPLPDTCVVLQYKAHESLSFPILWVAWKSSKPPSNLQLHLQHGNTPPNRYLYIQNVEKNIQPLRVLFSSISCALHLQ